MECTKAKVFEIPPHNFSSSVEIAAVYVVVNCKVLMLQIGSHKKEAGAWGVPAGKVEKNEEMISGAARELLEETGIVIPLGTKLKACGSLYIRKPALDYTYHLFTLKFDQEPIVLLSSEHQNFKWVTQSEARKLELMNAAIEPLDFYFQNFS